MLSVCTVHDQVGERLGPRLNEVADSREYVQGLRWTTEWSLKMVNDY